MKGHVPQPDSTEVPAVGLHPPEHGVVERASIHGNRVTGIEGQHAGPDDVAPLQGHVCDPERALDAVTMRMLEQHRGVQREHAARNLLPDPVWVFSSDAGHSPWRPDYPTQTYLADTRIV